MRSKIVTAAVALLVAASLIPAASAGGKNHPPKPSGRGSGCQIIPFTNKCKPFPPSTTPPVVTPPTLTPPPGGGNPPPNQPPVGTPAPPPNPSLPSEAFCLQTKERGETFVQANPGAFDVGGAWYAITVAGTPVVLDGHTVTPLWENGKGVILAAKVPGVGLTCGQPYVSTDGVYANANFGLRGAAWDAAFPTA